MASVYTYRRGSIFWALILIAVGVLFLYQNFNSAVHPWQIIAKFWPILIIFWGISKLIDYVNARSHPEAATPPLFSGSEVVLLVLVLILGTLISKAVLSPWWHAHGMPWSMGTDMGGIFGNRYTYTQNISVSAERQPHVVVAGRRGDIEVRAADTNQIQAAIRETVTADSEQEAKKIADQLKFSIENRNGHYQFVSNEDSLPDGGRGVRLDLNLRVPASTSVEVTSEHGDVTLQGVKGEQTLTANHGNVRVNDVAGLVRVERASGSAEIRGVKGNVELEGRGRDIDMSGVSGTVTVNGDYPGDLQFRDIAQTLRFTSSRTTLTVQKLNGRLEMEMGSLNASGIDGPFEISTREKDIELDGFKSAVKISNTNGDINLKAAITPVHPIEVNLNKGQIEIALPPASNFQIEATSRHGEVESDFAAPTLKVVTQGESPSLSGSYGNGGPTIRLTTAYGTIHLIRQGIAPPSPNPPKTPKPPTPPAVGNDET
jgi:DUF4097 and DUF4098 domain-containing protein YvlB